MNNKLKNLLSKWEYEFKADLMENIDKKDYKGFLQIVINDYMPIWIQEAEREQDIERIELYNYFKAEFKKIIGV